MLSGWRGGVLRASSVVIFAGADVGFGVVGDTDVDGMQTGGCGGWRLEAEQVVVVDVVRELVEALVEALLGGEVGVLATGENSELVGDVFSERVGGYDHERNVVGGAVAAVAELGEELLLRRGEGDSVDNGVGAT